MNFVLRKNSYVWTDLSYTMESSHSGRQEPAGLPGTKQEPARVHVFPSGTRGPSTLTLLAN